MAIDGGDSCRGGISDNIKLGLHKYFHFCKAKNQNTLISLVFNKNIVFVPFSDFKGCQPGKNVDQLQKVLCHYF